MVVETERLVLREWEPADLPLFVEMNADQRVMRYFPGVLSEVETEAFYNRIVTEFKEKGYGLYAVALKSTGRFIGYVGLHEIGFDAGFAGEVEIGWRLAADFHNRGYATEAALAVLEVARQMGLTQLYSFTAMENKPSERVMQKIGMERIGEFMHPGLPSGHPLQAHVLYRVILDK